MITLGSPGYVMFYHLLYLSLPSCESPPIHSPTVVCICFGDVHRGRRVSQVTHRQ